MQLKLSTDYAIRIVLYLSIKKKAVLLQELSENIGVEQRYIIKFLKKLHRAGIVNIEKNMEDGVSLAKDPKQITIFDIIEVMENTTKINICLEKDGYCSRFASEYCPVRKFYYKLQNDIESVLKSKTIYDLLNT